ncbi:DNA-processing protein DprA [Streptomyces beihaiensis]|uniref:DNA-processing protein DprA n=1 Tax=Streptomyces beihaiensis TaxID=2984495 RepID=A0ABT3TPF3_9ACTN|nr:DNA-processing protein DprA [Streptomyces beihaiensis]MCX3058899.1 DNA-processing protein DprA [Streptomyces beihaiensis]
MACAGGTYSGGPPTDGAGLGSSAGDGERCARAWLARILEPGWETAGRWLREFGAEETARLIGAGREAAPLPGVRAERWAGLLGRARETPPGERELERAARIGARFVCPGDAEWPGGLDELGDARPVGLWVRGAPNLRIWALRSVAVVGARACTDYGVRMGASLGAGLAERGWVVVSGGAYGVDAAAHRGALGVTGATVAVLACGIDRAYPRGHVQLIDRIVEQGLVIGELPLGAHPTPSRFILRNRVIAALTAGTVVVEAAYRSGALGTARWARRLGRHVMGVPGPVTSGVSAGVHELLRHEAVLVTDAAEVVELVGEMGDLAPERRGPMVPRDLLPPETARVLAILPAKGTRTGEQIGRAAGRGTDDAVARLYELRSLGFVERHGDGWKLTRQAVRSVFPEGEVS